MQRVRTTAQMMEVQVKPVVKARGLAGQARVAGGGGSRRSSDEDESKGDASRMRWMHWMPVQELHIEMALLLEQYPDAASTPAPVPMPKKLPVPGDAVGDVAVTAAIVTTTMSTALNRWARQRLGETKRKATRKTRLGRRGR